MQGPPDDVQYEQLSACLQIMVDKTDSVVQLEDAVQFIAVQGTMANAILAQYLERIIKRESTQNDIRTQTGALNLGAGDGMLERAL